MSKPLMHLVSLEKLPAQVMREILADTTRFKAERGHHTKPLEGKTWALIFSKSSTRTRVSFEVGIQSAVRI